MSSTVTSPPPSQSSEQNVSADSQQIDQRLKQTGRQVKRVDAGIVSLQLLVLTMTYLLVVVAVDHWLMSFGVLGRWFSLLVLLSFLGVVTFRQLLPLILRRINPVYAARAIETCTPSLKNSLINYLLLRREVKQLAPGMYVALEDQAAHDIQTEHVDAAVDKSLLIRYGYALAIVIACCAIYKVVSPKDPLQSLHRVIMPWSSVQPATRYEIVDVTPKNCQVFLGKKQTVTVKIAGTSKPETVQLSYSTTDGRFVDRQLNMEKAKVEKDGIIYSVELFEDGGLDSSLDYRILAGDARSSDYRLDVVDAPLIRLESVRYRPPSYTNETERFSTSPIIRGLEGTRVKIIAAANLPIKSAEILFDVPEKGREPKKRYESIAMQTQDKQAIGEFTLELKSDRTTATHTSYCIVFTTTAGQQNEHPVTHRIRVESDLEPMVEILEPETRRVELPLDRHLAIEIRAVDPDFGVTELRLEGVRNEQRVFKESLLQSPDGVTGQVVETYVFRPLKHGLAAGDVVRFRGFAADNRHWQGKPAANVVNTPEYEILIAPPLDPQSAKSTASDKVEPAKSASDENKQGLEKSRSPDGPNKDGPNDEKDPSESPASPPTTKDDGNKEVDPDAELQEKPKPGTERKEPMGREPEQDKTDSGGKRGDDGENGEEGKTGDEGEEGESASEGGGGGQGSGGRGSLGDGESKPNDQRSNSESVEQGGGPGGDESQTSTARKNSAGPSRGGQEAGEGRGTEADGDNGLGAKGGGKNKTGEDAGGAAASDRESGRKRTANNRGQESEKSPNEDLHDGDLIERLERYVRKQQGGRKQNEPANRQRSKFSEVNDPQSDQDGERKSPSPGGTKRESDSTAEHRLGAPETTQGDGDDADGQKTESGASGKGKGTKESEELGQENERQRNGNTEPDDRTQDSVEGASRGQDGEQKKNERQASLRKAGDGADTENGDGKVGDDSHLDDESNSKPTERKQLGSKQNEGDDGRGSDRGERDDTGQRRGVDDPSFKDGDERFGSKDPKRSESSNRPADTTRSSENDDRENGRHSAGDPANAPTNDRVGKTEPPTSNDKGPSEGRGKNGKMEQDSAAGRNRSEVGKGGSQGREHTAYDGPDAKYAEQRGNVEFAEKATELVLDYLRDQQSEPDDELLDEVGWTKEDLRDFVQRWDKLQRDAKRDDSGKRQWTDALKSLGLKPVSDEVRRTQLRRDAVGGNSESGGRSQPPAKYLRQFRAFRKSAAKAESDGPPK